MGSLLQILLLLQQGGIVADQLFALFTRAKAGQDPTVAELMAANDAMNQAVSGWDAAKGGDKV
ncbi:MAG TPA: hypothetical protein VIJ25_05410 [Methylococcales bacterium]